MIHRRNSALRPRLVGLAILSWVTTLAACQGEDAGAVFVEIYDDPSNQDPSSAWIGLYAGTGEGSFGETLVTFDDARLSIRVDADSVRLLGCPRCLTVSLDSLFHLVNVVPTSEVSLRLQYETADTRRMLQLDRWSGGGGIGNVLTAQLVVDSVTPAASEGNVQYIFERR